ncbi:zinc ribbon domain-containing protein [Sorangium cellulosum]|uniref:zinc ribbon domain-containing protein n=1 Tax=Sorangium cellulosum TaxID=56 RepID=UPI0013317321|nr:zinc ribbon domain-containing protein [Sorangium cellulosum]
MKTAKTPATVDETPATVGETPATVGEAARTASDTPLERQIVRHARYVVPLAVLVLAVVAGLLSGPPAVILVLAGGALVGVIAILWASLRVLVGETPLSGADAYALGAPSAEEEQKQAVLRALKDLEFERSVGKISDEDYAELVAKYRAEAKRLLRLLDAGAQPRRDQVAELVAKRLRRAGLQGDDGVPAEAAPGEVAAAASALEGAAAKATSARRKQDGAGQAAELERDPEPATAAEGAGDKSEEAAATEAGESTRASACAVCGTVNDHDALFCKKCGTRRAPSAPLAEQAALDEAAGGDATNESGRAS